MMRRETTVTKTPNNCQGRMSSSRPRSRRWVTNSLSCLTLPMSTEGPSCWTICRHPSGLLRFDVYYHSMIFPTMNYFVLIYRSKLCCFALRLCTVFLTKLTSFSCSFAYSKKQLNSETDGKAFKEYLNVWPISSENNHKFKESMILIDKSIKHILINKYLKLIKSYGNENV